MVRGDHGGIYWVGTYFPSSGLSINAYLIIDDFPTLINASAPIAVEKTIKKIRSIIDLEDLQYIVLNQSDVAYAGGLKTLISMAPQARVVTSEYEAYRLGLYGILIQPLIVQDDDMLSIGKDLLRFHSAPFAGSPDAIFVYESVKGILFSGEAFSTTVSRWKTATTSDMTELIEAYYDTRIGDSQIARDSISMLKTLDIRIIAPGHGPVLKRYADDYIKALSRGYLSSRY